MLGPATRAPQSDLKNAVVSLVAVLVIALVVHGTVMFGWSYLSKDERHQIEEVVAEIEKGPDRSTGIVAAAYLEDQLTHLLKSRLRFEDEKIMGEMFRSRGPLGSFSAKIDMGYLMHLYSEAARRELETIKDIRNSFAHRMWMKDFDVQSIRDLANNLKLSETTDVYMRVDDPPEKIEVGDTVLMAFAIGPRPAGYHSLLPAMVPGQILTARQKYIRACQFFISAFGVLIHAGAKERGFINRSF